MKKLLIFLALNCFLLSFSQENQTIEGENYNLKTLVDGELSLYANVNGDKNTFFISFKDQFEKITKNNYKVKYKQLIGHEFESKINQLNFRLRALITFTKQYNLNFKKENNGYLVRLGVFGGVSNTFLFNKPNGLTNDFNDERFTVLGAELEFFSLNNYKRHSLFLQLRQTLDQPDVNFSLTQFTINHRFKFINSKKFNMFLETEFISLDFVKFDDVYEENDGSIITNDESSVALETPFSFGIGMAYQIAPTVQVAVNYNDFYALAVEDNGETPVDFTLSLKFTL
ncbi:hypothetical protein [Psychroflexus sp. ALD_RP9]|uniref:hypothetical protein n=1 Tax=Psychroflexus sp. ALD_RP9 TaxID=2777186 RepID=UPI001A8E46F8|nr:hypothetical protein [Psychroflexus sp. ALD_RP9]QSS96249.1 hypothetical protein IMZ30_07215 [Psychroflexus sp. ALD_RP9]